jgi:hypothetical protein
MGGLIRRQISRCAQVRAEPFIYEWVAMFEKLKKRLE